MTTRQHLSQIRADLSAVTAELVRNSKSRKIDQIISRGINIGMLTAAETIIAEVLRDMDEDEGATPHSAE